MQYRGDKKLLFVHLMILTMVAAVTFFLTMRSTDKEHREYKKLVAEVLSDRYPDAYEADQKRDDIYREIVLTHKGTRLQTRITADRGVFTLKQQDDEILFREKMDHIYCIMQEELSAEGGIPFQVIRIVKADHASYDFKTNTLVTDKMLFERHKLPGHQLPATLPVTAPMVSGHANSATITFKESGPVLHADHLKVNLPRMQ